MSRAKLGDEPGYQTVGKTDLSCDPPNPNGNKSLENVFIYIYICRTFEIVHGLIKYAKFIVQKLSVNRLISVYSRCLIMY